MSLQARQLVKDGFLVELSEGSRKLRHVFLFTDLLGYVPPPTPHDHAWPGRASLSQGLEVWRGAGVWSVVWCTNESDDVGLVCVAF